MVTAFGSQTSGHRANQCVLRRPSIKMDKTGVTLTDEKTDF